MASWVALVVAVSGVVAYAVQADGYQAHRADLNDGGIWVTSNEDGSYGRINKPIGELDGTVFSRLDSNLDIVQDGSSVVGVDLSDLVVVPIDPSQMRVPGDDIASIPGSPAVGMAGGTLAVLDTAGGGLWATREDPEVGVPAVSSLADQTEPLATVGEDAALAVGLDGTVHAVSAAADRLVTVDQVGEVQMGEPEVEELPGAPFSDAIAVTAVGGVVVVLDSSNGRLSVVGGADAEVPAGSVLQQPGPSAAFVLVGAREALLSVDLASGEVTTVADGVEGEPARPVRLGDCRYGAWAGATGAVVTACGEVSGASSGAAEPQALDSATSDLVFRTNRRQIVLNDRATGQVWDVDSELPTRLDNWDAFNLEADDTDEDDDDERVDQGDRRPPKAVRDNLGARPGRTTVLYPLDNDTAPSGRLLAIRSVRPLGGSNARLAISPDGQTVQITLPGDAVGGTSFEYFIDDGRASVSAHATVRVAVSPNGSNSDPRLREGFEPRSWTVPAGGTIDVPVLPDWRDPENGDPVSTVRSEVLDSSGTALAGADTRVTATGAVRFRAPAEGGQVAVAYEVTDGLGEPVTEVLDFTVQSPEDSVPVPPTANDDVIAGETGKPIIVNPLANDLPGADPVDPDAVLKIAGEVADVPGAEVTTDLVNGTISVRSDTAQTYFLEYDAAYGSAETATGRIRVDVRAPANPPPDPVAVPDTAVLYGQAATVVDVLANDVDPAGGLLSVPQAVALADNQLDVAVIDGRWLRISARQGRLAPNPQVVRYTVTNGRQTANGQVVVNQRPAPTDDAPVTLNDDVTVREGSSHAISVLDNDFSPSGGSLTLVGGAGDGADAAAGRLDVRQGSRTVGAGLAFVSGRNVRYVAPTGLEGPQRFTISYQVVNEQGDTATGKVRALVLPVDVEHNNPPEPPIVEGRTVSGETAKLRLPGYGVDPDGDAVTILALDSAPTKGRVTRIGANSIDYTAYPGSSGTDEFTYVVTDALGAVATGTVRVAVAPPSPPQPPLAVADSLTLAPGRTAVVDLLGNDLVAPGNRVSIVLVDPPAGVRLLSGTGPVEIGPQVTRGLAEGRSLEVVYRLTNGLAGTQSTLTVRTRAGFNNPPVVSDAFGTAGDGRSVTVDVLSAAEEPVGGAASTGSTSGAYDPDGSADALVVTDVVAPPGVTTRIDGPRVTVERGAQPMVVPFRVRDADGGEATASLYVPAADSGLPVVDPDALIVVQPGKQRELDLADYVTDPSGSRLRLTLKNRVWASPGPGVEAQVLDDERFSVSAAAAYEGPGAVVLEVTDGTSVDDPDAVRSIVTVPVLVGDRRPILRCPQQPIEVPQADFVRLDVAAVCHLWTPDQADAADLTWSAAFDPASASGLSAQVVGGGVVQVDASGVTEPGEQGTLRVAAGNSRAGLVRIRVVRTPPPSLAPIRVSSLRAGESQTIDLAPYLTPGVSNPVPTVVEASQLTSLDADISASGSSVTVTAGAQVHGRAVFRVVMSDVPGESSPARQVEGRIVLEVLGVPDVPRPPVPGKEILDSQVALDWRAPPANGAPIDYYEVRHQYGGRPRRCPTTSCVITGLTNQTTYRFSVRAHNAVGFSGWSGVSSPATPDEEVTLGGTIRLVEAGDQYLSIAWNPIDTKGGSLIIYRVSWQGGQKDVTEPELVVTDLDNHRAYVFTVRPRNAFGVSITSSPFQPVGTPQTPAPPTVTDQETAGSTGAVSLTWPRVDPNGPEPVRYTVYRDKVKIPACTRIATPNCDSANMAYDGHVYAFAVKATNGGGESSPIGPSTQWRATGKPASWGTWTLNQTGENNQARARFTIPTSRGAESSVRIYVDGARVRQMQALGELTETFDVPDNLGPHTVYLEVCNEGGACTQSSTKSVQTYGPLVQGHIHDVRANVDGRQVSWTIEVDSNGDAATVRVTSDQGRDEQFTIPVGVSTITTQTRELDFSQTENITVTLSDPKPERGPVSVSASATTEAAPQPTVVGSRGASCSDDPGVGLPPCRSAPGGPDCTDASCAYVHLKLGSWRTDVPGTAVFCSVNGNPHRPYDPLADLDTVDAYGQPGGTVTIECFNALGQQAQTSFTW